MVVVDAATAAAAGTAPRRQQRVGDVVVTDVIFFPTLLRLVKRDG